MPETDRTEARPRVPGLAADLVAERVLEVVPRLMVTIRREMREGAEPALTVPQTRALAYVGRNPGTSLTDVAAHLGVRASSASVLVDRLVRQGLLARTADPDERRRLRLDPTPAGRALVADARARARDRLRDTLAVRDTDDLAAVMRALDILERAVGPGES